MTAAPTKTRTRIELGHGSGGRLTHALIRDVFLKHLQSPLLAPLDDGADLTLPRAHVAMTTDGFVVKPRFFAGGDIGSLAINGTVNDLLVSGAVPRYLSLGAILEEGLEIEELERIAASIATAARRAGVEVVTGDTKVVERGHGDGVYLTTAGIGEIRPAYEARRAPAPGDRILVSGPVGDHGAVIMAARHEILLGEALISDCAPVGDLVDAMFACAAVPRFMRDPTRGGLASLLCDLAEDAKIGVRVHLAEIPRRDTVAAICDVVGVDPLHLACEGRVVVVVGADQAGRVLTAWRALPSGQRAADIGELVAAHPGAVTAVTEYGGARLLSRPTAELLPRIC